MRVVECPLNLPFVKSGNLLLFSLLSVFAGVDVLGTGVAIFRRNGGMEPRVTDAAKCSNDSFAENYCRVQNGS